MIKEYIVFFFIYYRESNIKKEKAKKIAKNLKLQEKSKKSKKSVDNV